MRDHDVMIGSRYVPGGGVEGGFTLRRENFMSSGINWYARILLGLSSKDNSGAFRCYRVASSPRLTCARFVRGDTLSRKRSCTGASEWVVGSAGAFRSCSRTGGLERPRSTAARPPRPSGSCSSLALDGYVEQRSLRRKAGHESAGEPGSAMPVHDRMTAGEIARPAGFQPISCSRMVT